MRMGLFAHFKSKSDPFLLDYINMIIHHPYDKLFIENGYKDCGSFGKIEEEIMNILETYDYSNITNDKFDFFLYANHIFYFKNVFLPFRDLIKKPNNDKNPKEIADFERNNKSVQKFKNIIHQTVFGPFENNPKIILQNSYYLGFFMLIMIAKTNLALEYEDLLYEMSKKSMDIFLAAAENKTQEWFYDGVFFALERVILGLFSSLQSKTAGKTKLDFILFFSEKYFEKFERLVYEKKSSIALAVIFNIWNVYKVVDPEMTDLLNLYPKFKKNFLKFCEFLMKEGNVRYEMYYFFRKFLYPVEDVLSQLEIFLMVDEPKLKSFLENSKQIALDPRISNNPIYSAVVSNFYKQLYTLFFNEHLNFFTCWSKDYKFYDFPQKFIDSFLKVCLLLFNPFTSGNWNAMQIPIKKFTNIYHTVARKSKFIGLLTDLTAKKISTFDEFLSIKLYENDFFCLNPILRTEINYEKYCQIKQLELLLSLTKRFQRNLNSFNDLNSKYYNDISNLIKMTTTFLFQKDSILDKILDNHLEDQFLIFPFENSCNYFETQLKLLGPLLEIEIIKSQR